MKLPVPPRWWTLTVTGIIAAGALVVGTVKAAQQVVTIPGAAVTVQPAGNGHAPARSPAEPSRTPPASHGPLPRGITVWTPPATYAPLLPRSPRQPRSSVFAPYVPRTHAPSIPSRSPRSRVYTPPVTPAPDPVPVLTPDPVPPVTDDPIPSDTGPQAGDTGDDNVQPPDPGVPDRPWHHVPRGVDPDQPGDVPQGTVSGW